MIILFLILMFALSYVFVGVYRSYALKKEILDHPNQRSSHSLPIPRGGGVVFPVLWLLSLLVLYFVGFIESSYLFVFIPSVCLIGVVSFLDDRYNLPAHYRFLAQLVAVVYSLFVVGGLFDISLGFTTIHWGWFGYIVLALALVWSINLYNFMDGIDGIAVIEALFVFGFGGYFIWCSGGNELAIIIWSLASIVFGFLLWNKPPAKIFMGDVGSTLLGFLVMLFAVLGEKKYNVPVLLWVILYGVFWFDATITLIRRLMHGDKWYEAHRLHAYQRLQQQGWSHGKILLGVMVVNIILTSFAFLAFYFPQYMFISLFGVIIVSAVSYLLVEKIQPMYLR